MTHVALAPSLLAYFDASIHHGADNATPTSAAVGFLVEDGTETYVERSLAVDAFVSSAALEYRSLLETVRAVDATFEAVSSLHVHGDADAVLRAVDPGTPARPSDGVERRRVAAIRDAVADVPLVTYRSIPRTDNERAHRLARRGHEWPPTVSGLHPDYGLAPASHTRHRVPFVAVLLGADVNWTAALHATFAVLVGAGFLASGRLLRYGLFGLGIACFVAGIVLARRDDETAAAGA